MDCSIPHSLSLHSRNGYLCLNFSIESSSIHLHHYVGIEFKQEEKLTENSRAPSNQSNKLVYSLKYPMKSDPNADYSSARALCVCERGVSVCAT